MPGTHMGNVPGGSQNNGPPATSTKANAQSPESPGYATNSTPAVPGGATSTPPATSTKASAQTPTTPGFATGQPGSFSSGGAHGAKDAIGGNK